MSEESVPSRNPNLLQMAAARLPGASWLQGQQVLVAPTKALADAGIDATSLGLRSEDLLLFVDAPIARTQLDAAAPADIRLVATPDKMTIPADWGTTTEIGRLSIDSAYWVVLKLGAGLRSTLSVGASQRGRLGEDEDIDARSRWFTRRHKP